MPELPDVTVYIESLQRLLKGNRLTAIRLFNPFLLRTAVPPISSALGKRVVELSRIGKRIVISLEGDLHLVQGEAALRALDPGGIEILDADLKSFCEKLLSENHTLKRALTDPRLFAGIGNAYSDEILHRAKLSPIALTKDLSAEEVERLYHATRNTLEEWTERLRGEAFPEKVTAFREGMAVHGRYGKPCPVCGAPVQRIVYAENETNYCARCQTGGRILADRALSRLLKKSWPRSIDELP